MIIYCIPIYRCVFGIHNTTLCTILNLYTLCTYLGHGVYLMLQLSLLFNLLFCVQGIYIMYSPELPYLYYHYNHHFLKDWAFHICIHEDRGHQSYGFLESYKLMTTPRSPKSMRSTCFIFQVPDLYCQCHFSSTIIFTLMIIIGGPLPPMWGCPTLLITSLLSSSL